MKTKVAEIRERGVIYSINRLPSGTLVCGCRGGGQCHHIDAYNRALLLGQHAVLPGIFGPILVAICDVDGSTGIDPLYHEAYQLALDIMGSGATPGRTAEVTQRILRFARTHGAADVPSLDRTIGKTRRILVVDNDD